MSTPRIVSLLASGTEMVAALGAEDLLVGRSHECDWPPAVRSLPAVSMVQIFTDTSSAAIDAQIKALSAQAVNASEAALTALSPYRIDLALLQELRPDVIITQTQCEVCAVSERDVAVAVTQMIGITPTIVALAPHQLSDVWEDLARIGEAIGRSEIAKQRISEYIARLAKLEANAPTPRPRLAFLEWADPMMGAGNWMPELILIAGGEPTFGEIGHHSPWLTMEQLTEADPDCIIVAPCGYTLERAMQDMPILHAQTGWNGLQAVQ